MWRIESARIVGALARYTGDFALAEDVAQEALAEALVTWPRDGVPGDPGRVAAHGRPTARDRRVPAPGGPRRAVRRPRPRLGEAARVRRDAGDGPGAEGDLLCDPDRIDDDVLALMFIACHPVLSPEARVALTLRVVGGLTSDEIARAFLVPTATVQARITRAKKTLAAAQVPFEVPPRRRAARAARLGAQRRLPDLHRGLDGDVGRRPDPAGPRPRGDPAGAGARPADARRARGARPARAARADRGPVPRPRPDATATRCCSATRTGGAGTGRRSGAAAPRWPERGAGRPRARAVRPAGGDRRVPRGRAVGRGDRLGPDRACSTRRSAGWRPSPVVELNRAVAVSMADGPAAALPLVDDLVAGELPAGSHLLPSVRGELLTRLGRPDEARSELERAVDAVRQRRRARGCSSGSSATSPDSAV